MNVYSQLIKAKIEQTATDLSDTISGLLWHNTTSKFLKYYNGSAVKTIVDSDSAQSISNKTLDLALITNQGSSPSAPSAGYTKLYAKTSDGNLYRMGLDGIEKVVGSGGGGSSLVWRDGDLAPIDESQDGIFLKSFSNLDAQEMYLTVNVPSDYLPGTQIKLRSGSFFSSVVSGNVLFRSLTSLLKPSVTVMGVYPDQYTSTNIQVAVNAIANTLTNIGDIDLTSSIGTINSVAVAAGDKLIVKLVRAVSVETSGVAGSAKLLINNLEIKFTT